MLVDKRSAGLIQSIITLARNLGFSIVAEGVETAAQADFLRRHGCHYMQGYLFGRARPAMEFNETHEAEDAIRHIGPAGPVLRQIK
jgi:EAL domain-containing protein (putative c-di-GMP-specific phosphodiesterase class I)